MLAYFNNHYAGFAPDSARLFRELWDKVPRDRRSMIHVDRIQRRFGARVLFDGLIVDDSARGAMGARRPERRGKTTLLRILVGRRRS